jgi:hypothetical protein
MTLGALLMTFSDGSSCGITFDCHSEDSGGVIYFYNTGHWSTDCTNRVNQQI